MKENLCKRCCAVSNMCPICQKSSKTTEHLLFKCAWVRVIWFGCDLKLDGQGGPVFSIPHWMCDMLNYFRMSTEMSSFFSLIIWIGWFIWKDRNNFAFNHINIEPSSTLHRARVAKLEYGSAPDALQVVQPQIVLKNLQGRSVWQAHPPGSFKVNCNVAIKKDSSVASIAVLLRNFGGRLIDGLTSSCRVSSSLQGEALACRYVCLLASTSNLSQVEIKGDNKSVIQLCVSEDVPPWECGSIFTDIQCLASHGGFSFCWAPRTANSAAHWVAQASLRGHLPLDWVSHPPPALANLLWEF
ncbi:uncharacterized protein LOC114260949 [Camellia sinensis]|uniref:uncharacterized protein LOC114260949 n=1 Tax=Camellia sinensis TaxID=4442 RepID=UPI001035EACE|nr:uncharacterized protein LOC114260949 [Camellia sinensis]